MLRILLTLAFVVSAGCAKKQPAPKAPDSTAVPRGDAPGGGAPDGATDADDEKKSTETMGDPCDGGEAK